MSVNKVNLAFELYRKEILARIHQNKRLYSMPIEQSIETGEVVGPSCLIPETGEIQSVGFQFKLRKGDRVKLCFLKNGKLEPVDIKSFTIKNVIFSDVGVVRFKLDSMANLVLGPNLEYFMVMDYNPVFDWMLLKKLRENIGVRKKADINLKIEAELMKGLNSGQENSIETILSNKFSGVIQGPPGTGKTEVLSRLAEIAVANNLRVGILSFTNKAVDNALARISRTIQDGVYRVGTKVKVDSFETVEFVEQFSKLSEFKVFGATTHKFLSSNRRPEVDIIILDEASQIPSYFLAGIKHSCSNIVMIGDQHQLPPIMQVNSYNKCEPDCFSFYKNEQSQLPMLDTQYRMNETIQDWSSQNYYEGKLKAHESNAKRDIFSSSSSTSFGESIINYHNHNHSRGSESIASRVVEYAKEAKKLGNLNWEDIGIISPHRIHAASINKAIQEQLGVDVSNQIIADTVDRYQGREKEFVIFSVSDNLSDPAGFLNDYRRINVAVTRAKSRFYVVSDYRRREGEEFSDFLNWCESISGPESKKVA